MASAMASIPALKSVHAQLKTRMEKTVEDFRANLLSARTGRASVHMLDQVKVDYYGSDVPLSQVAQLSTPEAQMILVSPWEMSMVAPIEKAIRTSNLGFNPMHDGKVVRVPIPPMNEERRKETVKDKTISADDEKRANEEVQQLTDAEIKKIEEMFKAKEKEIMTV